MPCFDNSYFKNSDKIEEFNENIKNITQTLENNNLAWKNRQWNGSNKLCGNVWLGNR